MKKAIDTIISCIPYAIVVVMMGTILDLIHRQNLSFSEVKGLTEVLIWPTVVFFAFLFFRRVFTYLFFSMESFGFFGTRGKLKDIREVISEQVEKRLQEQKINEEQAQKFKELQDQLDTAAVSKASAKTEAEENLKLAKEIFENYKKVSDEYAKVSQELEVFRREKAERVSRIAAIRERIHRRRNDEMHRSDVDHEPTREEIDAAGEAYIQQRIDEDRGK